jgi:pimeloyl-ACP methyl ester carboxylesterase/RimJ/RimL family protein N-acetyltransferase
VTRTPLEIPVPGGTLAADRWDGPESRTVLLHAGVADRRSWYDVAERISGSTSVVAYDRRGFGSSPVTPGSYRDVDDLLAVLDALCPGSPAWLVGNSMGGQVALDAALTFPERVAGLVLISPAVSGAPEPAGLDATTQRLSELLKGAARAGDMAEVNRLETWLWLDGPAEPEGRVSDPARALALDMNAIVLAHDLAETAGSTDGDSWGRLEQLRLPVVVAWGELDVPVLIDTCEQLVAQVPQARRRVLTGTAHLPSLDAADQVAELILEAQAPPDERFRRPPARLAAPGLVLRPWSASDLPTMVELFDEPDVALRTPLPSPFTMATAEARLVAADQPDRLLWAVTRDGQEPLGEVLVTSSGEIGYVLGARHRGQGLAARAVALLREHAHSDLGLPVLRLRIEAANEPSAAVARRAGFRLTRPAAEEVENKGRRYVLDVWEHVQT